VYDDEAQPVQPYLYGFRDRILRRALAAARFSSMMALRAALASVACRSRKARTAAARWSGDRLRSLIAPSGVRLDRAERRKVTALAQDCRTRFQDTEAFDPACGSGCLAKDHFRDSLRIASGAQIKN
jgi:hypothetical protein